MSCGMGCTHADFCGTLDEGWMWDDYEDGTGMVGTADAVVSLGIDVTLQGDWCGGEIKWAVTVIGEDGAAGDYGLHAVSGDDNYGPVFVVVTGGHLQLTKVAVVHGYTRVVSIEGAAARHARTHARTHSVPPHSHLTPLSLVQPELGRGA